jgi:hypothetical protein
MRYDEYLASGFPIGSGVVEGARRYVVKDRTERTGMRCGNRGRTGSALATLDLSEQRVGRVRQLPHQH